MAALSLVLCSCATAQTGIPSSLPHIVVDPSLSGVVASSDAAKVFLSRLQRERATWAKEKEDMNGERSILIQRVTEAERNGARNAWWGAYGLPVALGSTVVGSALTAIVFLAVMFKGGL